MCDETLQQYIIDKLNLNGDSSNWSYNNQEQWKTYPNFFSSLKLPINIDTTSTIPGENNIRISYQNDVEGILTVAKQTIYFFPTYENNIINYNNKNYVFIGYHIHNSSENTINNLFYPIEIHFVNKYIDPVTKVVDYVVLALLFDHTAGEGAEVTNLDYKGLYNGVEIPVKFDLSVFNNLTINKHYNFIGTLTSPPFFQNTNFYLWEYLLVDINLYKNV
jgi:carbonic anhydrase